MKKNKTLSLKRIMLEIVSDEQNPARQKKLMKTPGYAQAGAEDPTKNVGDIPAWKKKEWLQQQAQSFQSPQQPIASDPSQKWQQFISKVREMGITDEEVNYFLNPNLTKVQKNIQNGTLILPTNVYNSLEQKIESQAPGKQIEDLFGYLQTMAPDFVDKSIHMIQPEEETSWPQQQQDQQEDPYTDFE